jgi:hypothetical protein
MCPRGPIKVEPRLICSSALLFCIPMRRGFRPATFMSLVGASSTFYLSVYGFRQASVLGRFASAHVVSFNMHNLNQIPKRIPGEETRPKW